MNDSNLKTDEILINKINNVVEGLIKIRDNRCKTWQERDAIADACNMLESMIIKLRSNKWN